MVYRSFLEWDGGSENNAGSSVCAALSCYCDAARVPLPNGSQTKLFYSEIKGKQMCSAW